MLHEKFSSPLLLTFVLLLQISHVLSEFPAQITYSQHQVRYGSGHKCSGILISNFTVLTSASCLLRKDNPEEFYAAGDLRVAMGNLNRFEKDANTFYTHVFAVKTHGRFNKRSYANNLAILELENFEYLMTVVPVLPSKDKIYGGESCYVLGWKSSTGALTETLMRTDVKTVARDGCNPSKNFPFATFCSTSADKHLDECVGEDGSGVICGGVLRGVVSRDCSGDGQLSQYTDISQLINWIALAHLSGSLKMVDNEILRSVVFSALDFAAYFINTPKIADDFEILKFLF